MDTLEVFVDQEDKALFNCPHCGIMKRASVANFRRKKHSLQVKCLCNQTFAAKLNFRKGYRKPTDLDGFFCRLVDRVRISDAGRMPRNCRIVNLSRGGLGFRHETGVQFAVGDELMIDFRLDDRMQSHVERKLIVRHVGDHGYVGCEFSDLNQFDCDKILGFYLMP